VRQLPERLEILKGAFLGTDRRKPARLLAANRTDVRIEPLKSGAERR
jgi:hypothetical protein